MDTRPKRRWLQFSLRTLLVVMTVLCVGPGSYIAYEQQKARRQRTAVEAMEKLGGSIEYDNARPRRSAAVRWLLGDDTFRNLRRVDFRTSPSITDADLVHLELFPQLDTLDVTDRQVTDAGLAHLAGLTNLQRLSLDVAKITDAGLQQLASLTNLQRLWLDCPQVTEVGIQSLQSDLPHLRIVCQEPHQ